MDSETPPSSPSADELPTVETVDLVHYPQRTATPTLRPYHQNADRAIEGNVLETFLFPDGHILPISEKWFSEEDFPKDIKTWPHISADWEAWVERMKATYEEDWRRWNIYEVIVMSSKPFKCDTSLIFTLLSFWNSKINCFVLPWGVIAPTLLDVAMITGLPIHGQELPEFYRWKEQKEMPPIDKKAQQYGTFIKTFQRTSVIPSQTEHKMFLMYWFCRFFACVSGKAIAKTYSKFVDVIMSGEPVALGSYFLGLLFNSIHQTLQKLAANADPGTTMFGPWWFLQLWIHLYFPHLFGPMADVLLSGMITVYGHQLQLFPAPVFNEQQVVTHLLSQRPRDRDFYPYYSKNGFPDCLQCMPNEEDDGALKQLAPIWNRMLKPQVLMIGYEVGDRFNPIRAEVYFPQYLARQLGCKQGIPRPSTHLVELGMVSRPILEASQIQALSSQQMIISHHHSYLPFKIEPGRRSGFTAWWDRVWKHIFPDELAMYSGKFGTINRRKRKSPVTQEKSIRRRTKTSFSLPSLDSFSVRSGLLSPTTSRLKDGNTGDDVSDSSDDVIRDAAPLTVFIANTLVPQRRSDQEITSHNSTVLLQPNFIKVQLDSREENEQKRPGTNVLIDQPLVKVPDSLPYAQFSKAVTECVEQPFLDILDNSSSRSTKVTAVETSARSAKDSLVNNLEAIQTHSAVATSILPPANVARSCDLETGRVGQGASEETPLDLFSFTPALTRQNCSELANSACASLEEIFTRPQVPLSTQIRTILHFDLYLSVGYLSNLQMFLAQLVQDSSLTPSMKEDINALIGEVAEINCIYPNIQPFQASSSWQLDVLSNLKAEQRKVEFEKAAMLARAERVRIAKLSLEQKKTQLQEIIAKAQAELTTVKHQMSQLNEEHAKVSSDLAGVEARMKTLQSKLLTAPALWKFHSSRYEAGHKIQTKMEANWKRIQTKWSCLEERINNLSRAPFKATYCAGADLAFRFFGCHL